MRQAEPAKSIKMLPYGVVLFGSYTIAIAATIGLIRFHKINRSYRPFIFITIAALANEVASTLLIMSNNSNAISTNMLNLVEGCLWLFQIKVWGGFKRRKWVFPALFSTLVCIWIVENLVFGRIQVFSSIFAVTSAVVFVFLAIDQVNQLIVEEKGNLLRNSRFLICVGIIIFFTYRIMVESFYLMDLTQSNQFLRNVFGILVFVNVFVNLLFALAILWIPTRQKFSLPFL